jgi:hypothetical protein
MPLYYPEENSKRQKIFSLTMTRWPAYGKIGPKEPRSKMEKGLSVTPVKKNSANPIAAVEAYCLYQLEKAPNQVVEILCPSLAVKFWLESVLIRLMAESTLPHLSFSVIFVRDWLQSLTQEGTVTDPYQTLQQHLETASSQDYQLGIFGLPFMPLPFQELVSQTQGHFFTLFDSENINLSPRKQLVLQDNPYLAELQTLSILQQLPTQNTLLEEVVILCPDTQSRTRWTERLLHHGYSVWGTPHPDRLMDFERLKTLLTWVETSRKIAASDLDTRLEHPSCRPLIETLIRLMGEPVPLSGKLAQAVQTDPALSSLQETLHALNPQPFPEPAIAPILTFLVQQQKLKLFSKHFEMTLIKLLALIKFRTRKGTGPSPDLESLQGELLFDPSHLGLRILSLEEVGGMPCHTLLIPEVHRFFAPSVDPSLQEKLSLQVELSQEAFAIYAPLSLLWSEATQADTWLDGWQLLESTTLQPKDFLPSVSGSSDNPWLTWLTTAADLVFTPEEIIALTPSKLETYLNCPRQFFYQHLLGLQDDTSSPQAALGTLVHRILEVFNRQDILDNKLERLLVITKQVFQYTTTWPELEQMGFTTRDLKALKQLSCLQQQQIERQLLLAFEDLGAKGYFDESCRVLGVEEKLNLAEPFGLPGLLLEGRADLIREKQDGTVEILDYKTSRQKFNLVKMESNMRPLLNALEPLDWSESDTTLRYQNREYQLPLYWLMARETLQYAGRSIQASIQMVRPPVPPGKMEGCGTLTLPQDALEKGYENMGTLLKKGVVEPMRASQSFLPLGSKTRHCKHCAYVHLCEGPEVETEEDEGFFA